MLAIDPYRELRIGKRHKTNTDYEKSEHGGTEDNRVSNLSENAEEEVPKLRVLTQEAVNEEIKGFIAPSQ